MAKVMVFNPRGRGRAPKKGAEKIASRRFGAGAGVYRPSFAHGHETSDSVRERLVRYKIAKPTSGKRVLLNSGEAEADATNPKKRSRRPSKKKGAAKTKRPAAKKAKSKVAKKPRAAKSGKSKAGKAKGKPKSKARGKSRRNSAPVSTVDGGVGSLVLAKSNPRGKQRRSAKGKFARSAQPSVTPAKARQILKDGFVTGPDGKRRTLTAKQRKYFGWAAGGYQEPKRGKRKGKGKSASAASAKVTKGKTARKAKSKRSTMAKKKRAKKAVTKAAKKAKPSKRKSAKKKAGSTRKRGKKKATAKKAKAKKAPAKRRKAKSKKSGVRKAARRGKSKAKRGRRKSARRNDESMPLANKPKRRKAKKARRTRRNDQPLTEKQLQELAKKLAPKYRAAQTAVQKKKAQETAQRAALTEVAARLGVPAPAAGPVSTMAKDLAQRVSDANLGLKVSEKEIKRLLAGIPKPAEAVSVDQAIAKMATAIEKIAGKTTSRRSSSRKSRKGSSKRTKKSTRSKSKAKRNGKRRSSKKSTVLAKATKKRGKKKTARKGKGKAKKGAARKAGRRKGKAKKGSRKGKGKTRRNAGFDMVRRLPGASYVEDYASNLKEVGVNYLPGGLAGLVGAYGIPSLAFQFMPAKFQSFNQGWWGVLTSAIGVGVAAGLTGVVASKVQPGSARKQTLGAVLGGSLAIATRVISALTAPTNPIRRAIGTDSTSLADYAGMRDLYAPDYLGDHPMVLANAADSLVDLDYGQPGDQIGMTPDEGIADFVAPMLIQPGQSGKAYAPMSDFAAPAMDDLVAAGMGQAWPGAVDNTLQLSGAVPVTDFALGDGADEMGPSDVDDGCDLSDFIEVQGPQTYHQGR